MVSLTLKVILHLAENDSKHRDVAPLRVNGLKLIYHIQYTGVSIKFEVDSQFE